MVRERPQSGAFLRLGPGPRLAGLPAVLVALGAPEPPQLDDLAEVLDLGPGPGRLALDCDELPAEDVGLVRRFVDRHPDWSLVLLGTDPRARIARSLLALARAHWLPWPPDLDQLRTLAAPATADAAQPAGEPAVAAGRAARAPRASAARASIELGSLLEELLAGLAVGGDDAPRFQYDSEGELAVGLERATLAPRLESVFRAAGSCAGAGAPVQVHAEHGTPPAGVSLSLSFAFADPADGEALVALASGATLDGAASAPLGQLATAIAGLREVGVEVELDPRPEGRLGIDLGLPLAGAGSRNGDPSDR